MTGNTVGAEFTGMFGRFGMTGNTTCIQPLELAVLMAILTGHIQMFARQREVGAAVIKFRSIPFGWIMTGGAIRAELSVVLILVLVAGVTILGGGKVSP